MGKDMNKVHVNQIKLEESSYLNKMVHLWL